MLGLMDTAPRCSGLSPGSAVKFGSSLKAILTLPDEPRTRKFWMDVTNSSGKYFGSTKPRKVRLGSAADRTTLERSSSPFSRATPAARPPLTITWLTLASTLISAPNATGCAGDGAAHPARAAFGEAPGAEGAVDLAHVVMEQHIGRTR